MYYWFDNDGEENVSMLKQDRMNSHISMSMGRSWDVVADNIQLPYKYLMRVARNKTPRLDAWFPGSDLMQQALVDVLLSAGVDNLQVFPADVRRQDTGEEVPGYVVVNIVGLIACANMAKSESTPIANYYEFDELVIDPTKIRDQLIFRLDESPGMVLVNEKVADMIEAANLTGLMLSPLDEAAP